MRWEYRDASGCLLGIVDRYHGEDGTKEVRPLAYAEHQKWGRQWRWLGLPRPRPLYGLDRLAVRPAAPVVVVEGEKSADAATSLLPEHVVVTSFGGGKVARLADWTALAGRHVVIWPDHDEPGQAYANDVVVMLAKLSPAAKATLAGSQAALS